jgi:hypothetical protein
MVVRAEHTKVLKAQFQPGLCVWGGRGRDASGDKRSGAGRVESPSQRSGRRTEPPNDPTLPAGWRVG